MLCGTRLDCIVQASERGQSIGNAVIGGTRSSHEPLPLFSMQLIHLIVYVSCIDCTCVSFPSQVQAVLLRVDVVWSGDKAKGTRAARTTQSVDSFIATPNFKKSKKKEDRFIGPVDHSLGPLLQPVYVDQYQQPFNGGLCSFICSYCSNGKLYTHAADCIGRDVQPGWFVTVQLIDIC